VEFAYYNGLRTKAEPGLKGTCPHCGSNVTARCGSKNIWHWSHTVGKNCDPWQEPETLWHRRWKEQFGDAYSEVRITTDNVFHIADVYKNNIVFEFQNSPISAEEIVARENFYGEQMMWVINGAHFETSFAFYDEEFLKEWRIVILNEFDAIQNYNRHPGDLLIEDLWVRHEPVKMLLLRHGFEYSYQAGIYYLSMKGRNRAFFSAALVHEVFELYQHLQRKEDTKPGRFEWANARRSWENSKRPVFIDFGGDNLFRITSGMGQPHGNGIRISKQRFIEKYCTPNT